MVNVNVKVRLAVLAEFDLRWNLMLLVRFKERLTDLTPSCFTKDVLRCVA